jgi:NADH-quinone oxidoreductase subunit N
LAVVGVINAAISAAYYLRIVGTMWFRPAVARPDAKGGAGAAWAMAACALIVLGIGCYPGPWVEEANRASEAARLTYRRAGSSSAAQNAALPSPAPILVQSATIAPALAPSADDEPSGAGDVP